MCAAAIVAVMWPPARMASTIKETNCRRCASRNTKQVTLPTATYVPTASCASSDQTAEAQSRDGCTWPSLDIQALAERSACVMVGNQTPGGAMLRRHTLTSALAGALAIVAHGAAGAQPATRTCTASFAQPDGLSALASADLNTGGLNRLFVEMGPTRTALATQGTGISGAYKVQMPELTYWHYLSIYQPANEWLTPGSVRLDYSGFRIGWPEFRLKNKVVKRITVTVSQGNQSMTIDVAPDSTGRVIDSRVVAIDFEAMLVGDYPAVRVADHSAWRVAAEKKYPVSVTFTDASNGKIMARGATSRLAETSLQPLLSGGLSALREKFKAGRCD